LGLGTTSSVSYFVQHSEYPATQGEVEIAGLHTEHTIELALGCYLVVSGWVGTPANAVLDVQPMLEFESGISSADWVRGRDGRLGTNRVKAGEHALALEWKSPEGKRHASHVVEFALAPGEQRDMALELVPCVARRGRLDDAVPRPVVDGEVQVNVVFGGRGSTAGLRVYGAKVAADGTFELPELPPGPLELIAMCDGWAATYELRPFRYEYQLPGETEKRVSEGEHWSIPMLELAAGESLVVPMTPTAAVELELVDAAGAPLMGASFWMFPNVHWPSSGYSQLYLDRKWSATTDASGRARLANLPTHAAPSEEGYRVVMSGYEPVEGGRDGNAEGRVELEPGRTASLRVVMKPNAP
jgi:hypothetical protein